jgi:hypothetical protein
MDQAEIKKICRSCGADVTHKGRHKNRDGEYSCLECHEAEKASLRRRILGLTGQRVRLIVLYAILAVLGSGLFWKFLEIMNQPSGPGP